MNSLVYPRRANDELLTGPNLRLRIGEHVIDTGALRVVTRPELPRLTSKAVAVLVELVRDVGQTVTRDALLDRVWTGRFPTPDVLTQAVKELRRALGDDTKPPQYIETIPKVGYRLIAPVLVLDGPEGGIVAESDVTQVAIGDSLTANDAPAMPPPPRARTWLLVAGALVLVFTAVAIALLIDRVRTPEVAAAPATWKVGAVRAITSDQGAERRPQLSPDGTRVAFAVADPGNAPTRVVVRSIEPSQLVRISAGGADYESMPSWSPDGTRIAFERASETRCAIYVASSLGGDEREIAPCRDYNVSYYDWTPDGQGLLTAQSAKGDSGDLALVKLDLDSGNKEFLKYAHTGKDQDLEPHYSPDGRFIAFRRGVAPYSDLYVMAADGGDVRQVTHIASRIRGHTWSRDGRALIFASNFGGAMALYAVDVKTGATEPLGISPAEYPSASHESDAVVYEIPRTQNQLAVVNLDKSTPPTRTLAPSTGSDYAATLSPSGDRLVFVSDRSGQLQLWLYDWASDAATPLTEDADTPVFWPRWSADGKRIVAVQLHGDGSRQLIEIDVASRRQRALSQPDENILFGGYGPDPDSYLFAIGASGRSNELVLVSHPREAGESRKVIESGIAFAQVDARARAIYYTTSDGEGLYRYAIDDGAKRFVSPNVSSVTTNGWRVVDGHVWYVTGVEVKPVVLHDLDPETRTDTELGRLDITLKDVNFSVMPERKSLVLSEIGTEDTDVGMFTLTRAGSP